MSSTCWEPAAPPAPAWEADGCKGTIGWVPGSASSSKACLAIACFMVACAPPDAPVYTDLTGAPTYVCGEAPVVVPPVGPPGGGDEIPVERAFSSGFSNGYS